MIDFIIAYNRPAIFHLKDFHEALRESYEIRRRRNVYVSGLDRRKFTVITSASGSFPKRWNATSCSWSCGRRI